MPSLRRSFSSPSVRSSPYPASLSSSSSPTARTRPNPRRSSGSATAERRVLADIEWWRVHDGQCDHDLLDHAQEVAHSGIPLGGTVTLSTGGGSLEPTQTHSFALDSMQFALPIALHTTSDGRHGRDSSVESTPEMPTAPLETVQHSLGSSVACPLDDLFSLPSSLMCAGGRQIHPLFGLRSISAPVSYVTPDFADMGGDLFSLDQNLFH